MVSACCTAGRLDQVVLQGQREEKGMGNSRRTWRLPIPLRCARPDLAPSVEAAPPAPPPVASDATSTRPTDERGYAFAPGSVCPAQS
jgi:hypothetical protein